MQRLILSEILKEQGITQKILCQRLRIAEEVLSRNLRHNKKGISLELLLKIADVLSLDVRSLFSPYIPSVNDLYEIIQSHIKEFQRMGKVVVDTQELVPQTTNEYLLLQKLGLYPVAECCPFITKKGNPNYYLDNMAVLPQPIRFAGYDFYQLEVLFNLPRIDNADAQIWLMSNLFQGKRMDARKKTEYKAKFSTYSHSDWKLIQIDWMKFCLMQKYQQSEVFRETLQQTQGLLPIEDATHTDYASNIFWGAKMICIRSQPYYFGCNVLGKLLKELRDSNGKLNYSLPKDFKLFNSPITSH